MRHRSTTALALALAMTASAAVAEEMVDVTIENISPQPFSSSIVVAHFDGIEPLWTEGEEASAPLTLMAEEGHPDPFFLMLNPKIQEAGAGVVHVVPPIPPGESRTIRVRMNDRSPVLSAVWMLGMTNDGFSGVQSVPLTDNGAAEAMAYEAGTEFNSETEADILALMGRGGEREGGVVTPHEGVRGDTDLPDSCSTQKRPWRA